MVACLLYGISVCRVPSEVLGCARECVEFLLSMVTLILAHLSVTTLNNARDPLLRTVAVNIPNAVTL